MKTTRWLMALLMVALLGCPGDYAVPADTSQPSQDHYTPTPDWPQQPDLPQTPDYYPQWPDAPPSQPDIWPWPPDTGYFGSPFGCQQDSDCFGLKCCDTPWGVKLCAEVCRE